MQVLNAALIGYGYAGRTFHAPLLAHTPGLRLAAIYSSKPEQVRVDWPQTRAFDQIDALLADPELDLVVIATPNDSHFPLAHRALLAGKHVVIDKPFTATLAEAEQLAQLAFQSQRVLSVFHNRRWDADFLTLKDLIAQGRLGQIVEFESHFDRFRPQVKQRWREQAGVATGLWFDLGPHLVDQALQLFGAPQTIQADLAILRADAETNDYFHVVLGYAGLRVILHGSCLVSGGTPRFLLHGTAGSYRKQGMDTQEAELKLGKLPGCAHWGEDPLPGQLFTQSADVEHISLVPNQRGDYREYYQAIGAAIRDSKANPVTPEQAIQVMAVIEGALDSARQGRTLPFTPQ